MRMPSVQRFSRRSRQPSPCASTPRVHKRWAGGPSTGRETSLSFRCERNGCRIIGACQSRGSRPPRLGLLVFEPPCALLLRRSIKARSRHARGAVHAVAAHILTTCPSAERPRPRSERAHCLRNPAVSGHAFGDSRQLFYALTYRSDCRSSASSASRNQPSRSVPAGRACANARACS